MCKLPLVLVELNNSVNLNLAGLNLMFIYIVLFCAIQGNDYIAGKNFSMADILFFPTIAFVVRMGMDLKERYPNILAYYDRVVVRPSVKATWPPHWNEGPGPRHFAQF